MIFYNEIPLIDVIIVENDRSEKFVIELTVNVSQVTERPNKTPSEQFDVALNINFNISPATSKTVITTIPFKFKEPIIIKTKSLIDNNAYLIPIEVSIISATLLDTIDNRNGMPGLTFQVGLVRIPVEVINEPIKNTFFCNYCRLFHPIDWRSEEHIIPKSLNNKNHVLKNSCKRVNNFFVKSFENQFKELSLIEETLLTITPPREHTYRDRMLVDGNIETMRFITPTGEYELIEEVKYSMGNQINLINLKNKDGESFDFKLTLPFEIIIGITGVDRVIKKKKVYSQTNEVEKYLQQLSLNSEINPEFHNFLKKIDGTFSSKEVKFEEIRLPPQESKIIPNLQYKYELDDLLVIKMFFKIAWTHSCLKLGIDNLSNPISNWILRYLISDYIFDNELPNSYNDLFHTIILEEKEYKIRKYNLDKTKSIIETIESKEIKNDFVRYYNYISQQLIYSKQLISFSIFRNDGTMEEMQERLRTSRFHVISLIIVDNQTLCNVKLFGGFLEANILISETPLFIEPISSTIINY